MIQTYSISNSILPFTENSELKIVIYMYIISIYLYKFKICMGSSCELWIDNVVNIIYKNIIKGYTVDKCIEEYYIIYLRELSI